MCTFGRALDNALVVSGAAVPPPCLPNSRFPGEVGWCWVIWAPAWDRILVMQGRLRNLLPQSFRSCSLTSCLWYFNLGLSPIQSQIWDLYRKYSSFIFFEYVLGYALKIRMPNVNTWKLLDLGGWTRDKCLAYSLFTSRYKKIFTRFSTGLWNMAFPFNLYWSGVFHD